VEAKAAAAVSDAVLRDIAGTVPNVVVVDGADSDGVLAQPSVVAVGLVVGAVVDVVVLGGAVVVGVVVVVGVEPARPAGAAVVAVEAFEFVERTVAAIRAHKADYNLQHALNNEPTNEYMNVKVNCFSAQ